MLYLGLGSNLGNRLQSIDKAHQLISQELGEVIQRSKIYESEPWGFSSDQWFLNQVLEVSSDRDPMEVVQACLHIERLLGRRRTQEDGFQSRIIDIDLLLFSDFIISVDQLTLPHPRLTKRRFVLVPLAELAPSLRHPVSGKPMAELLSNCLDPSIVRPFEHITL